MHRNLSIKNLKWHCVTVCDCTSLPSTLYSYIIRDYSYKNWSLPLTAFSQKTQSDGELVSHCDLASDHHAITILGDNFFIH